jgi:6-phosphogluconate dehydrogenase
MGANLARNLANKEISTVVFNRTYEKAEKFINEFGNEHLFSAKSIAEFVKSITRPRKIFLMVPAGNAVDQVIDELIDFLESEDIIVDLGNSHYKDSQFRYRTLKSKQINFFSCGISGGEEGALKGPSIMPSGDKEIYFNLEKIFQQIAAKDFNNRPCVTYIGEGGAGHFVKMIHNGIEYALMQLIADSYETLRSIYKLEAPKIADIFEKFNKNKLNSYLIEITIKILREKDPLGGGFLIDQILDEAAQKGTGKWTVIEGVERGVSIPTLSSAVFARFSSSLKTLRGEISKFYREPEFIKDIELEKFLNILENSLYAANLITYAEGISLIQKASLEEGWGVSVSEISRIWQGGCIIRSKILETISKAFENEEKPALLTNEFIAELKNSINDLRQTVSIMTKQGISQVSFSAALSSFESSTRAESSANLIQAMRDFFGAHTFRRRDSEGVFHHKWE